MPNFVAGTKKAPVLLGRGARTMFHAWFCSYMLCAAQSILHVTLIL